MVCQESTERGFTRLELCVVLVCVSAVGLLATPLRAGNTDHSRTAQCMDNLRRLATAMAVYALDNGWFPPNGEDGSSSAGRAWASGNAGPGGAQEFNPDPLRDPTRSLLYPYLESGSTVRVYACPADERIGRYQGTDPLMRNALVPASRSVALNGALGVNPYSAVRKPTDGPWLDNNHSHTLGRRWRTYGRPEHVVAPSPSRLFTFIDEDARSINDGVLSNGMQVDEWIDWPSTRHDTSGTLAYADGHVEVRRWVDSRTVVFSNVNRRSAPKSPDVQWLRERTSAELPH